MGLDMRKPKSLNGQGLKGWVFILILKWFFSVFSVLLFCKIFKFC